MAYLLTQAGSSLYRVDLSSGIPTALTLPVGAGGYSSATVTLDPTRKPKFAVLNRWIVMVNSPSRNLAIDAEGIVRLMVPRPPMHGPILTAGGTGLTGAYQVRESFIVTGPDGELWMESPLGPASAPFTAANQGLTMTGMARSTDTISGRRVYRTLAGGSIFFHLLDIVGNDTREIIDNTPDAILSLLPAAVNLVSPPGTVPSIRFKNIIAWKSRLWAVADEASLLDTIFISDTNLIYAWPNSLIAHPKGADGIGVVGFAPRRNQLGILKRTGVWQIAAQSSGTGISISNLAVVQIASGKAGCLAEDSIVVVNDKAYWLGNDGVYEWSDDQIKNITDETVAPWFKSDDYFNRSRFPNAFAKYNELRNSYDLHLSVAGSSVENRWVSLNLDNKKWYGPHLTSAFTTSHAAHLADENNLPMVVTGGTNGVVYVGNQPTFRDGTFVLPTAIDFDVDTPFFFAENPDVEHYWGELSLLSQVEGQGFLTITPKMGRLNASTTPAILHDLRKGRERLRRLGRGAGAQLRFQQSVVNEGVVIHGIELPVFEYGRR